MRSRRSVLWACLAIAAALVVAPSAAVGAPLTWSRQHPLLPANSLTSVRFVNSTTGWAAGQVGTVLKTADGGASWKVQPTGSIDWWKSVDFIDTNSGWVVGMWGAIA